MKIKSSTWRSVFDVKGKTKKVEKLREEVSHPDFWNKPEGAVKKQKELSLLEDDIEKMTELKKKVEDIKDIHRETEEDEEIMKELQKEVIELKEKIKKEEFRIFLSGKFDRNDAIIEISSGAGGRDAEDFAAMLLRMYERYAERKNYKVKVISTSFGEAGGPEGRTGIKDVSLEIKGSYVFGFLKKESGVHRLVRKSPFSSASVRHTSFAQVSVIPKIEEKDSEVEIKEEDLRIDTFRSSGPGGQHVNRRETAVRITHLPTKLTASSQSGKLQGENKKEAMNILRSKIEQLQEEEKKRKMEKERGELASASWGNQIRNYVLHPYKLAKDLRTKVETSNVEEVLDGSLDSFIESGIKK